MPDQTKPVVLVPWQSLLTYLASDHVPDFDFIKSIEIKKGHSKPGHEKCDMEATIKLKKDKNDWEIVPGHLDSCTWID
jgi:hypothetical protein